MGSTSDEKQDDTSMPSMSMNGNRGGTSVPSTTTTTTTATDSITEEQAADPAPLTRLHVLDNLPIEEYISQPRFNHTLTFHSAAANKDITASYAVAGSQSPTAPTFLYIGGIFGGRLHSLFADWLCKDKSIRGIFVDKPGMGLFSSVPIDQRLEVWLEAIALILQGCGKVALVSLSGGAPYALNLLWRRPDLIRMDVPIFLLSPWVHPWKSGVRMHLFMSYLPNFITRNIGKLASFAIKRLLANIKDNEKARNLINHESRIPETCGATPKEVQKHREHFINHIFNEDTSGSAEEYLLGIKNPRETWGVAADYEDFARKLSRRCVEQRERVCFMTWFAEGDAYIGEKGIEYFKGAFGSEMAKEGLDFECEVVKGTDHEQIGLPEVGIIGKMVEMALGEGGKKSTKGST